MNGVHWDMPWRYAASCPVDMSKVCDYAYGLEKDNPSVHWSDVVGGPGRHHGYKRSHTKALVS